MFSTVLGHNACVSLAFPHGLRRLTCFPLYGVTMSVFYSRFCIVLDVLRVFLCMGSQCVYFTRLSLSFKTSFAFSSVWGLNACISHVYLYHLRRLTCFPPYCPTMHVLFTFLGTRLSSSFKTPYAFSSVWRQNACVLLVFLHRFRRLTRFPPYWVIMLVFHSRFCIV